MTTVIEPPRVVPPPVGPPPPGRPAQAPEPSPEPAPAPPPEPAGHRHLPAPAAVVMWASFTCAGLAVWFVVYVLAASALPQARAQEQLHEQLRRQLAEATAPVGGEIEPGTPVAVIEAPSIGLRQVVVEGTAGAVMRDGPGHRRNSPLPGQPGSSVIFGHASAFGAPFRRVTSLVPGAPIVVTTGQGRFEYEVTGVRRARDPLPAPLQSGGSRIILVTAEGHRWRTGWAANHVVYVDATMKGETQLGKPGRPVAVTTAELPMQGDPDAFVPLVFWLQLLVAAAAAMTWARVRWGGAQTWVVGLPVLAAALWGVAECLGQMLPNLT
jgi:sortase A